MVSIETFKCEDLLKYNMVNFDPLTETYGISFYMSYMARWPEYFKKAVSSDGIIVGYGNNKSHIHSLART
jgi:N-terminal acetyltransferase B complex catalytic subunit